MSDAPAFTVTEFVSAVNQTLEYAYSNVIVTGEIANFRVSKNRWVYFDLKDETSSVRFFGTVYQMPGPLEDGMTVMVRGVPKLHPQYGFSVTVQAIKPTGEGSIKKAAALLEKKLRSEGLFDESRKRPVPYPPTHIGLITSGESAAFRDFTKILNARWGGVKVTLIDVQVQGDPAMPQIVSALKQFNTMPDGPDVLVVTRGGGSADDLQAFSTEQVTRAVAASRIPTVVAIGHEVDISLAELAADQRASTPSNAAELLVPDRAAVLHHVQVQRERVSHMAQQVLANARRHVQVQTDHLSSAVDHSLAQARQQLTLRMQVLQAYNPQAALQRGYALVRQGKTVLRTGKDSKVGDEITVQLADATLAATIKRVILQQ
ncbi:MAG TPA: exodeoxyribonuclease VII large subunit [Candidatus Saccharimonadales bacterium]|nr:exodeoxyribonuclease VII large subunit [Candidatus Saccharimonadales bacterium]